MSVIKENRSVICILLIAILLFAFSTVVTSATNDSIKELGENTNTSNTAQNEQYEGIKEVKNESNTEVNTAVNTAGGTTLTTNTSNTSNTSTLNTNSSMQGPNKDMRSNDTLSKAGIEDYPSAILISVLVAASIYGYIKIKKYNSL